MVALPSSFMSKISYMEQLTTSYITVSENVQE